MSNGFLPAFLDFGLSSPSLALANISLEMYFMNDFEGIKE